MVQIYHANLYGIRQEKERILSQDDISTTNWQLVSLQAPFYLLIPQDLKLKDEYERGEKITDVMPVNSVGIVTARDSLTIHWKENEVWETIKNFTSLSTEIARVKYSLGKDSRDWKVELAQADLHNCLFDKSSCDRGKLSQIMYRPFDNRYTYYTGKTKGFHCMPRREVMQHMLAGKNLGLITCRQQSQPGEWSLSGVTNSIIESCAVSNKTKEINSLFPLYVYPETAIEEGMGIKKHPNFSPEFFSKLESLLGYTPTPEAIFYYIYGILHSPTYRDRYAEFLKIDFPRVPLTSNDKLFRQLADYGEQLVQLHLMTSPKLNNLITEFVEEEGERTVAPAHPKYQNGTVQINKNGDKFTGVPEEVWNFYVGGYQPCQKWLKDRKERTLSDEDLLHYQKIVVALRETIELMTKIDQAIPGFPIQ